jgi:SAM-dependent methyltransferase
MKTEENLQVWNEGYYWEARGDEWSRPWGNAEQHWFSSILPRIHRLLPAPTILEIAPGYGRWTSFLRRLCDRLIVVDLSPNCIEGCKKRFSQDTHIEYHVNDGSSLEMVPDASVDLVFSYDSLVHVEADVIRRYLDQLARKLTPEGAGFIHHSNAGSYQARLEVKSRIRAFVEPLPVFNLLRKIHGLVKPSLNSHWRAPSVDRQVFAEAAEQAELTCLSQEVIRWHDTKLWTDCMSIFALKDSLLAQGWGPVAFLQNEGFQAEVVNAKAISALYSPVKPR